jgi:hypothetical protein
VHGDAVGLHPAQRYVHRRVGQRAILAGATAYAPMLEHASPDFPLPEAASPVPNSSHVDDLGAHILYLAGKHESELRSMAAAKLLRAQAVQIETLRRLRAGGSQYMNWFLAIAPKFWRVFPTNWLLITRSDRSVCCSGYGWLAPTDLMEHPADGRSDWRSVGSPVHILLARR